MSIPEGRQKINLILLASICATLALVLAFGIVKIQAFSAQKEPLKIEQGREFASLSTQNLSGSNTSVVASKTGKKYHLPDCPGVKQISEKNKIIFQSASAAEKAGYEPAGNCPGLQKK